MKIKIPDYIIADDIENQILNIFPNINKVKKNLSQIWTERILIFLYQIYRGTLHNPKALEKGQISEEQLHYTQIDKNKKNSILSTGGKYRAKIEEEIIDKLVTIRKTIINDEIRPFYIPHEKCIEYGLIRLPENYVDYILRTQQAKTVQLKIEEQELTSTLRSSEEIQYRRTIIDNTKRITLLNNHSSRATLSKRCKKLGITPTEYISNFNQNFFANNVCDNYGHRLHHKLTNINSGLIQHIRLEGESLKVIDIVNSQPFFSSILSSNLINALIRLYPEFFYLKAIVPIIKKFEMNKDYQLYSQLCNNGNLYEAIMRGYKQQFSKVINRKTAKETVFTCMFSDYKNHKYKKKSKKEEIKMFRKAFPSIYGMFNEFQKISLMQKVLVRNNNTEAIHKNVSLILQRVESKIMIDYIGRALSENNIFFTTIHDAIITTPDNVEEVKRILTKKFQELEIPIPQIKVSE